MSEKGKKHDTPAEQVIEIYTELLNEIWRRVAYLIGGITLQVLMSNAVRRTSLAFPFLTQVSVTTCGVSLEKLREVCCSLPKHETRKALQNLVAELFSLLISMSGDVIVRELAPLVKNTEEKLESADEGSAI
ncbi:MAG: hypothetical protein ACUBOA_13350 [Candidatus Loosdrechtia sp.]|uniref:hypothetical protein n=1 Tax=Candidatus Loosdrechtia sp. TaxID=3101272 RepID=UPI003A7AA2ED|nr:MAG: hypothetical protein QY305_03080 [Candidatus Jettenia sp. AMX2]